MNYLQFVTSPRGQIYSTMKSESGSVETDGLWWPDFVCYQLQRNETVVWRIGKSSCNRFSRRIKKACGHPRKLPAWCFCQIIARTTTWPQHQSSSRICMVLAKMAYEPGKTQCGLQWFYCDAWPDRLTSGKRITRTTSADWWKHLPPRKSDPDRAALGISMTRDGGGATTLEKPTNIKPAWACKRVNLKLLTVYFCYRVSVFPTKKLAAELKLQSQMQIRNPNCLS